MMKHLKSVLTLFAICAIVSVALAVCFGITNPIILERQQAAANKALLEVMPNGGTFTKVDLSGYTLPATIKEANQASNGGYVFQVEFAGFNSGNIAMIGVSADGKITGTQCITVKDSGGNGKDSASEIPKMDESGYYNGADLSTIDSVDTIAGVTVSTKAYRSVVKDALNAAVILSGGSVDLRDPAQILSDNLNTALGVSGVEFDTVTLTDDIVGVSAIYVAKTGEGHVALVGNNYIGFNAEGSFVAAVDAKTNAITPSDEDKATAEAAITAVKSVSYTDIDLSTFDGLPAGIVSAKVSNKGVYVIVVAYDGYKEGNSVEVTIDADGKVVGTKVLVINDTPSFGGQKIPELDANGHFNGTTLDSIDGVDVVNGSTVSTKAYRDAIKNALVATTIFAGGSYVDPFTAALNEALGVSGVEFEKRFLMEVIEGVDAVYVATNGAGYVCVIGDELVGVDINGNVVGGENEIAAAAVATIKATVPEKIDISAYKGVSKRVKSAMVTNGGVYVLEVEGNGFGRKGSSDYGASGEYILIRISITSDGKIIDCYTIYQSESKGYGDVCGTEEFYSQFVGKTQDNYEDIVIAGSTYTTDGYHGAIKNAYKAIAIFEEGGAQQ